MEFEISSSPSSTVLFAGAVAAVTLLMGGLFGWFALSSSSLSAAIEGSSLQIKVPIYGRSIPIAALDVASATIVDLEQTPQLRPGIRTNGIGLPGYAVGWFRLKNGEKALAAITSKQRVLYLRTSEGYVLLLSLADPERFIRQLASVVQGGG